VDTWIRKVKPEQAQGGKYFSNYTWHGDQDPSHPWWNGTQNCDIDLSDMRFSKLNVSWGKNFVENKMPEAHWKLECIERGARVVVITPEYNPTAYRADYWIPVRPETDAANFLGTCKIILDENLQDIDYIKGYTDMPLLVRTDTLQYLDPRDVIKAFQFPDYDLDTVHQISRSPKDLIVRFARDCGTIKPAALHNGEGVCHYFHMTELGRAAAFVVTLTGNIGKFGTGCHTWSGNYKAGIWNATPWSGGGLGVHTGEDPFNQTLDPNAHGKEIKVKSYYYGEEVGYWNHGDTALIVNTPKYGRKVFTGKTHMPSPSKLRWVTNVNILNNSKHHYDMVKNVDPNIECIVTQDIEMTSDVNHADVAFACNSWMEFTYPEMTATVSNPWLQIWKGGIRPLYDTRNDADTFAGVAAKL